MLFGRRTITPCHDRAAEQVKVSVYIDCECLDSDIVLSPVRLCDICGYITDNHNTKRCPVCGAAGKNLRTVYACIARKRSA